MLMQIHVGQHTLRRSIDTMQSESWGIIFFTRAEMGKMREKGEERRVKYAKSFNYFKSVNIFKVSMYYAAVPRSLSQCLEIAL